VFVGHPFLALDARGWHPVVRQDYQFAGRARSSAPAQIAGSYDSDVWRFQRQGLGRAMLPAICSPAKTVGAKNAAALNTHPSEPMRQRVRDAGG
jgi:GNAT superfamily N-acetyltransferase